MSMDTRPDEHFPPSSGWVERHPLLPVPPPTEAARERWEAALRRCGLVLDLEAIERFKTKRHPLSWRVRRWWYQFNREVPR